MCLAVSVLGTLQIYAIFPAKKFLAANIARMRGVFEVFCQKILAFPDHCSL